MDDTERPGVPEHQCRLRTVKKPPEASHRWRRARARASIALSKFCVKSSLEDGLKGAHFGDPGNGYDIYYREAPWEGASEHTVLHEAYEIIHETLCDIESDAPPDRKVCQEADRFAAAVLMQPEIFTTLAECSGLDVLALQKHFGRSYASVTLRLAEVMRGQPFLAVLYERREKGDPASWNESVPAHFRATVVARTPGFKPLASMLLGGYRGGIPFRGRAPSPRFVGGAGDPRRRYSILWTGIL